MFLHSTHVEHILFYHSHLCPNQSPTTHIQGLSKMNSKDTSPSYSPPSRDVTIIDISEDSDEENVFVQPQVELPVSPLRDPLRPQCYSTKSTL